MSCTLEPIAIVGSACRFPGDSDTPEGLWKLLKAPRDVSKKIPTSRFNVDAFHHPEATNHGTTNASSGYFLNDDISRFDASFFGIQPVECDAIDPQQRLLLETVYDSLCAAGLQIENYRGTPTAVYVGMMCDDWSEMMSRDWETMPTYSATGSARSIVSNRISYFFDWHGPSMSVDTACSSSLVAVHLAMQTLRSGESTMAIASGTNLILSPGMFIAESNLRMLSSSGHCAMWDASADGYARGEGVASVVLKTLSKAIADGDHIQCIIRETGVNQDGKTAGLTVPSNIAQTSLIRETYRRAGLDLDDHRDRPQFFYAHGTGTQAGDPQEAEAISKAMFPAGHRNKSKLYVGSIKTIIGHSEGTAGLAALIGTCQAIGHSTIPPNLHFTNLSPEVGPFYEHLEIPTRATPWPKVAPGSVKRVSINCFGFGGTNAHAIVEEYVPPVDQTCDDDDDEAPCISTPLLFSAASSTALENMLLAYKDYISANPDTDIRRLAWTLQACRSTLPFRKAIVAPTLPILYKELSVTPVVHASRTSHVRRAGVADAKILGIFTGQGAQWPRMGAMLMDSSHFVRQRIAELDCVLQGLPESDRPRWTIEGQLLADAASSQLDNAEVSQPLCLAVQVVLVDILHKAGITFSAVVGHSSGEIGAAYAAGMLSAQDAVKIAYYRGLHAKLACSATDANGAMAAVGMPADAAQDFCRQEIFGGRIQIAAVNAPSSVTLSGDLQAIDSAVDLCKETKVFCRKLRVKTAYHSAHMDACAEPYFNSLASCSLTPLDGTETNWYSSSNDGILMTKKRLTARYWVNNMCKPVLFADALSGAISHSGPFDIAIEIGPHPALKGPSMAAMEAVSQTMPYSGSLSRDKSDMYELSSLLGFIWSHLGAGSVDFDAVEELMSNIPTHPRRRLLTDLPRYPFDHQRQFWAGSRMANHFKHRSQPRNPILGHLSLEGMTAQTKQWRNILQPKELSWLDGHKVQDQIIFPATGYACMAVEAIKSLTSSLSISLITIENLDIGRAIAFGQGSGIEVIFTLSAIESHDEATAADFSCHSIQPGESSAVLNAKGRITAHLAAQAADTLPLESADLFDLVNVDTEQFYKNLSKIGYEYSHPFRGISKMARFPGFSTGTIQDQSSSEDNLTLHPALLDAVLQTAFSAWSFPGDGKIWSLHVPTHISSIKYNPYFENIGEQKPRSFGFDAFIRNNDTKTVGADIQVYIPDKSYAMLRIDGVHLSPLTPASPATDIPLFSHFRHGIAEPNGEMAAMGETLSDTDAQLYRDVDRVAFWYARNASQTFNISARGKLLPHFRYYLRWCDRMVEEVSKGKHSLVPKQCVNDSESDITQILNKYHGRDDMAFVHSVGTHVVDVIRNGGSMLQHIYQGNRIFSIYENGLAVGPNNRWLGRIMGQIAHRHPNMNILEIGAGTGGTTQSILSNIEFAFSSYTFTDISSSFFPNAEDRFSKYKDRLIFRIFDMSVSPKDQDFTEYSYDAVVAAHCLHVAEDIDKIMTNTRRLLKPGGYLIALEITSTNVIFSGMTVGTLPGWWSGAQLGRPWGPAFTLKEWDNILLRNGFSGIDTSTPDISSILPVSVFVTQAVDQYTSLLRNPLNLLTPGALQRSLAIIAKTDTPVFELAKSISNILIGKFNKIFLYDTIENLSSVITTTASDLNVLTLTDLDEPYMRLFNEQKFAALKKLWRHSAKVVWATQNAREDQPYSYMMTGMSRTLNKEYPNVDLQMLDIDVIDSSTPDTIAKHVLRHQLVSVQKLEDANVLWTAEPEIYIRNRRLIIPRVIPQRDKNDRYNSQRRVITKVIDPKKENVRLRSYNTYVAVEQPSPIQQVKWVTAGTRQIRVVSAVAQTLRFESVGLLRLCYGVDISSESHVLCLSACSDSPATVPSCWSIDLKQPLGPSSLVAIALSIIAKRLCSMVSAYGTLLVNDASSELKTILLKTATQRKITVRYSTSDDIADSDSIYLHPNSSSHSFTKAALGYITGFAHFSRGKASDAVEAGILNRLPAHCMRTNQAAFLDHVLSVGVDASSIDLRTQLREALSLSTTETTENRTLPVSLENFSKLRTNGASLPLTIIDWTSEIISAHVKPIDCDDIFSGDKTYFLVGLANELGQSLCRWMVSRGARNVVLGSRTPKVGSRFVDIMFNAGANVKIITLDLTNRSSLHAAYDRIVSEMPPIAGVVNGAMVLDDALFDNMSYDQFTRVVRPKVEGVKLLDELLGEAELEFFIVTSSITAVVEFSGQINYNAGNSFMTSMMYQRKKRGLVGSAMVIPAVCGIGYAARTQFDFERFQGVGYINISEEDFCTLFAEAILSGRPESLEEAEIITGIGYISSNKQVSRRDAKFSHYLRPELVSAASTTNSRNDTMRVRTKLASAVSQTEILEIVEDGFVKNVKRVLQIPEQDAFNTSAALVEQGVDSLAAVEIRSWLLKETEVDIPVLELLGGSSTSALITKVVDRITDIQVGTSMSNEDEPASSQSLVSNYEQTSNGSEVDIRIIPAPASLVIETNNIFHPQSSQLLINDTGPTSAKDTGFTPDNSKEYRIIHQDRFPAFKSHTQIPMSFSQSQFWFLHHFLLDQTALNFSFCLRLSGQLSIEGLTKAVALIALRHETFRTRYSWTNDLTHLPMQSISESSTVALERLQVSSETEVKTMYQSLQSHKYDLESSDAMKIQLLTVSDSTHYLLFGFHHIAFDGFSVQIFMKELFKAYMGQPMKPLLATSQYSAFSSLQHNEHNAGLFHGEIEFFRRHISSNTGAIELFSFSKIPTRKPMDYYRQHTSKTTLSQSTSMAIKKLATEFHCTAFHLYLSVLQLVILRLLPDTDEFFIGIADANRIGKEFQETMGCMVNLLPIRFDRETKSSIGEILKSTRDKVFSSLQYSRVPFDVLLQELGITRSAKYTPIFQIFLDYHQGDHEHFDFGGLDASLTQAPASTGYDMQLNISEITNGESQITVKLQTSLYSSYHTSMLLRAYTQALRYFVQADKNHVALETINIWAKEDIKQATSVGRGLRFNPIWGSTILHRIDEIASTHSNKLALKDEYGNIWTYKQMTARIKTICTALINFGASAGSVAAVFQEPTANWICSMLAIQRIGATYVPLDPKNGMHRLASCVKLSKPEYILVDKFSMRTVSSLESGSSTTILNVSKLETDQMLPDIPNSAKADDIAVILFTSGSTGLPKGVALPHSCLAYHAEGMQRAWNVDGSMVLLQITFSFDFSLHQIFTALTSGGLLYVVPSAKRGDPKALTDIMVSEGITHSLATPTEYDLWLQVGKNALSKCTSWKWALSGGEALPKKTIGKFRSLGLQQLNLYDFYGPVEATIAVTKGSIPLSDANSYNAIPTGSILPNYSIYIVDEWMQLQPIGVSGEICVAGPCIAAGYLDQQASTGENFIANPFVENCDEGLNFNRLYRTGDRGRLNHEGLLFFEGRMNKFSQVKIQGNRVEVGEVENAIISASDGMVSDSVVTVHQGVEPKRLIAFVVMSATHNVADVNIFLWNLRSKLPVPSYMMPSLFIPIKAIPVNPHGKVDHKALLDTTIPDTLSELVSPPLGLSEDEAALLLLWEKVLLLPPGIEIGGDTDFFQAGGNSILLIQLQYHIREAFQVVPRIIDLLVNITLGGMAQHLRGLSRTEQTIDWATETALSQTWFSIQQLSNCITDTDITVLVTGATGYIGRHILFHLVDDARISRVFCLVREGSKITIQSNKITTMTSDLSQSNLGLSETVFKELSDEADLIIHCAANRSFWDSYNVLRPVNVWSVRDLIQMALPRRVPIHFFSSGGVSAYDSGTPPAGGQDGYLATKWVSETMLRNVAKQLKLPVCIHKPKSVPNGTTSAASSQSVLNHFAKCANLIGARPDFEAVGGYLDLIDVRKFMDKFWSAAFSHTKTDGSINVGQSSTKEVDIHAPSLATVTYDGAIRLDITEAAKTFSKSAVWETLPIMDSLAWMGEAKRNGFQYVLSSQSITLSAGSDSVTSQR